MHPLPENTTITIANDPYLDDLGYIHPIGSCNELLCLLTINKAEYFLYLWNPATRSLSNKIEFVHRYKVHHTNIFHHMWKWYCGFGYDNSTGTYKIVCLRQSSNEVRVLNIGDNVWRNIQSFPDAYVRIFHSGVYVTGSLNWLTIRKQLHNNEDKYGYDAKTVTIDQFVIVSLDLSRETYRQLLPPRSFDKVPRVRPKLAVLMDSLCFSHDFNGTDLIIWQMKEFGVQDSWIQFLKISYHSLPFFCLGSILFPFYLSGNGDTLILACSKCYRAILYNLRDNTVEETRLSFSEGYVESLVPTC